MKTDASAETIVRPKPLANLLHRSSQANVRSTIQQCGRTSKPFTLSERLMISNVNLPFLER